MKSQTFKIRFIIKSNKTNQKGTAPIFAKLTLNGRKIELSTQRSIKSENWSSAKECAIPLNADNIPFNQYLESFRNKIYNSYVSLLSTEEVVTKENLLEAIFGKVAKQRHYLIETMEQHNIEFEKLVPVKYSAGSLKNYKTTLRYLKVFVPLMFKSKDIALEKVDYSFCDKYFTYLCSEKTCTNNGASKQIQRVKKVLNYAVRYGYITSNPAASFGLKLDSVNKVGLTISEVNLIESLALNSQRLEEVRDVFLFQCYTGLAYSDLKSLNREDIVDEGDEEVWIKMNRQKTNNSFSVPLMPIAMQIYYKYKDRGKDTLLPVMSNQKMNDALKIIQGIAGITKTLTTHLGRHSFAMITLNNDVPIDTVSRMMGHSTIRTTQIYAKVMDTKISSDMKKFKKIIAIVKKS